MICRFSTYQFTEIFKYAQAQTHVEWMNVSFFWMTFLRITSLRHGSWRSSSVAFVHLFTSYIIASLPYTWQHITISILVGPLKCKLAAVRSIYFTYVVVKHAFSCYNRKQNCLNDRALSSRELQTNILAAFTKSHKAYL